jgi:hypothetical protein
MPFFYRYISTTIYIEIIIDILIASHKLYPWPIFKICPACHAHRLWGHGYVLRYLDDSPYPVYLKRYRCPLCHKVFSVRPMTHYRRFSTNIQSILNCLTLIATTGIKSKQFSRQRQQYWFKGFIFQASRFSNPLISLDTLEKLHKQNIIVSTHSTEYFEIIKLHIEPHSFFAVTKSFDSS